MQGASFVEERNGIEFASRADSSCEEKGTAAVDDVGPRERLWGGPEKNASENVSLGHGWEDRVVHLRSSFLENGRLGSQVGPSRFVCRVGFNSHKCRVLRSSCALFLTFIIFFVYHIHMYVLY